MAIKEHLTSQNLYTGYFTEGDLSIPESKGHHMRILQYDQKGIFDVIRELYSQASVKALVHFLSMKRIYNNAFFL